MPEILLIGAGQLGSRHLQALAQLEASDVSLSVVDPSPEALAVARERLAQVTPAPGLREVRFLPALAELDAVEIDFAVIATGANCRLAVLRDLLARKRVRALLLEKVLFQSVAQLDEAAALLQAAGVRTWVNCPRRQFPGYQRLRELLAGDPALFLHASGHNWGLACNAIHFIDLWAFLAGSTDLELEFSALGEAIDSKRAGYREVTGALSGRAGAAGLALGVTVDAAPASVAVRIESTHYSIVVAEAAGRCTVTRKADGHVEEREFPVLFQSQLTDKVAAAVLAGAPVPLTPFAESAALHRPFLAGMLDFFQRQEPSLALCPIT